MADETPAPETVAKRPIAPRLVNGHKKPHVGPDHDAYLLAHAGTVGDDSDEWWAKVRYPCAPADLRARR
jgi:acetyl-CoA synthetase